MQTEVDDNNEERLRRNRGYKSTDVSTATELTPLRQRKEPPVLSVNEVIKEEVVTKKKSSVKKA